jgi:hypothetical protein
MVAKNVHQLLTLMLGDTPAGIAHHGAPCALLLPECFPDAFRGSCFIK